VVGTWVVLLLGLGSSRMLPNATEGGADDGATDGSGVVDTVADSTGSTALVVCERISITRCLRLRRAPPDAPGREYAYDDVDENVGLVGSLSAPLA